MGELSVRWNRHLRRWLALFNSGNPRGILMHNALNPWGPWSVDPVMIFDPGVLAEPVRSMLRRRLRPVHAYSVECAGCCDHVQDNMFPPYNFRDDDWGGEYGPYQIPRLATALDGGGSRIWFVMSTWKSI